MELLTVLNDRMPETGKERGKLQQVFEPSFDVKYRYNEKLILKKLDYMHNNPVKGAKPLAENPAD